MASTSREFQTLLSTLEERNVALGPDDVAWAFESAGTKYEIQQWTSKFLTEASLLTLEERALIDKHGQKACTNDAEHGHPVSDQSFEDAISSLQASTAAIKEQSRLLEAQRQALQKIIQRTGAKDTPADKKASSQSKVSRERSQLEYETNELADSLQAKFRSSAKQANPNSSSIQPNVERILERDDRLLDGLEKILPHLLDDNGDKDSSEEAQRLCQALKHFTIADIRARIDAAYLDGTQQHLSQANGVNGKASRESRQLLSLNAELDELCHEIEGLSAVAMDNQYRNPIVSATAAAQADAAAERASWTEYLGSAIQYSTSRMDYLLEQLDDQRAHANATKTMNAALDEVVAAGADKHADGEQASKSPVKTAQKGLKPLRLVQANLSDTQDPASQLLRQLDVRPPRELSAMALSKATIDKAEMLASLRANTERSTANIMAQSLADADTGVQQLLRAALAHSQYGIVHLESAGVRISIEGLEAQTQELSKRMRNLEFETIAKAAKENQEALTS